MQTSTKYLIGGAVVLGVGLLIWKAQAAPAPILTLAAKPGALLIQPDLKSMTIGPNLVDATGAPTAGSQWSLTFNEMVSVGGQIIATSAKKNVVITDANGLAFLSTGPQPTAAAVTQTLQRYYVTALPSDVAVTNPAGGYWTINYTGAAQGVTGSGAVDTTTGHKRSVTMTDYPSAGPQPPQAIINNALYNDLLAAL